MLIIIYYLLSIFIYYLFNQHIYFNLFDYNDVFQSIFKENNLIYFNRFKSVLV